MFEVHAVRFWGAYKIAVSIFAKECIILKISFIVHLIGFFNQRTCLCMIKDDTFAHLLRTDLTHGEMFTHLVVLQISHICHYLLTMKTGKSFWVSLFGGILGRGLRQSTSC